MTGVTFHRVAPNESRIYQDGDHVGDVFALDDPLCAGARYFVVHLDPKIHAVQSGSMTATVFATVAESWVRSHPLWE